MPASVAHGLASTVGSDDVTFRKAVLESPHSKNCHEFSTFIAAKYRYDSISYCRLPAGNMRGDRGGRGKGKKEKERKAARESSKREREKESSNREQEKAERERGKTYLRILKSVSSSLPPILPGGQRAPHHSTLGGCACIHSSDTLRTASSNSRLASWTLSPGPIPRRPCE